MKVIINNASILSKLNESLKTQEFSIVVASKLKESAREGSDVLSQQLKSRFESHDVTKELKSGADADGDVPGFPNGPSGGTYGNLASFFGLTSSKISTDLGVLKSLFSDKNISVFRRNPTSYIIRISYPELEEFYRRSPPPSPDGYSFSWLEALENGLLQNFSKFLYTESRSLNNSRTRTGIQTENVLRGNAQTVPSISYIKEIFSSIFSDSNKIKILFSRFIKRGFRKL
jgi:hypothetical protein